MIEIFQYFILFVVAVSKIVMENEGEYTFNNTVDFVGMFDVSTEEFYTTEPISSLMLKTAVDILNKNKAFDFKHDIIIQIQDNQCTTEIFAEKFMKTFIFPENEMRTLRPVAFLGPICTVPSRIIKVTDEILNINVVQMAPAATGDPTSYSESFIRLCADYIRIFETLSTFLQYMHWQRFVIFTESNIPPLLQSLPAEVIFVKLSRKLEQIDNEVATVIRSNIRVVVLYSFEREAARTVCAFHRHGVKPGEMVFITPPWVSSRFYEVYQTTSCLASDLEKLVEHGFHISHPLRRDKTNIHLLNMPIDEYTELIAGTSFKFRTGFIVQNNHLSLI
eukprot:TRINITY_DN4107_c0_g1_i2.p1 TRINITY_DN4107_c0_g1~~TRINITY_DN4107_c0_g1_i2.p1  ORF type:complete len:334 (+),score=29.70 TRINITY_DN4107_c0_g1_i2:81-1082(+)